MLTAEGCAARRKRLWNAVPADCDILLIGSPESLTYFAGLVISPFVFRSAEAGAILVLTRDSATLLADDMLGPFLEKAHVDEIVAPTWYDGNHSAPERRSLLGQTAIKHLVSKGIVKQYGVEFGAVASAVTEELRSVRGDVTFVNLSPLIRPLRRKKHTDEIATIQKAIKAGQAIITSKGEWVRYSTPEAGGAEYIAICQPAFSPTTVHRDD